MTILDFGEAVFTDRQGPRKDEISGLRLIASGEPGHKYYFGIDGDDTGTELESLFRRNCSEQELRAFSKMVNAAIQAVAQSATTEPIKGDVIFCQGDDLLFRGLWDSIAVARLHELYTKESSGRTCSIGFGETVRDTMRALKLAKGSDPKGRTVGILS